ncbi:MAG: tetratricopeptide repeat protein [Gammaproteobacteria bacterium]|nr:tetratricopeptide repeat protein [Gammaproteobacteria bacterium]
MGLVSELRRRNVFRVAIAYVIIAWIILQVGDTLAPALRLDDWVNSALAFFLILGFPIALFFAWAFELTPEGLKKENEVDRAESISHITGRKIDFAIIGLMAGAILYLVFDNYVLELTPLEIAEEVTQESVAVSAENDNSIAVLPFRNRSAVAEDEYFVDGIRDDILTQLAKVSSFGKVISRTSMEQYRETSKSIPQIGQELAVATVLEGGIQRAGDRVRINVQLIRAATDEHLWAETYDRTLTATNVFAIQSEIVETIVRQLDAKLTSRETQQLAAMPTRNFDAYTAYLKGRSTADIESIESLNAAIDHFKMAVSLDPDFALAYVGLADAYLTLSTNFWGGLTVDESNALAEPPLSRALTLDENSGEAHATLGLLRQQQGDLPAAEQAFKQAIALQPNYARVFRLYGRLRSQQGRTEEAMELLQKALSLDPYSAPVNYDVGLLYDISGRFEEALARYLRVIEIEPDHAFAYVYIGAIHFLVYGRADDSLIWYQKAAENDALSPSLQSAQAIAYLELGDPDSAKEWVDRGLQLGPKTFWPLWSSLLHNVYTRNDVAAQADARTMLELYPQNWGSLHLLRNADLAASRYDVARSRYARAHRELIESEVPNVNTSNYHAAVDLALVLMHLGEQERADDLLEGSLQVIKNLPRLGINGYYITDVRIFALQQRRQLALDALRQAIDEGWRVFSWLYLEYDPNLESIRGEPGFELLQAELKEDLAAQAERVRDLRASGELTPTALVGK